MRDEVHLNCHEIAARNEQRVLQAIGRFGGLTTRQLGRLFWTGQPAGMRMAQRTCTRLVKRRWILRRSLPNGGLIYVLGQRGARHLRSLGVPNISSRGHRDLKFDTPLHRLICNEVAIDFLLQGKEIWTEFEIQRGLAPVPRIVCQGRTKIPDIVVRVGGVMTWIEVENAVKSQHRLNELACVAEEILEDRDSRVMCPEDYNDAWDSMVFIAVKAERLAAVARAFERFFKDDFILHPVALYTSLHLANMTQGYIWGGLSKPLSLSNFLYQIDRYQQYQECTSKILEHYRIDEKPLSSNRLAYYLAALLEAQQFPLEKLSADLQTELNSYEDLHDFLSRNKSRIVEEVVIKMLNEASRVVKMCIGYYGEFLHHVISRRETEDG